MGWGKGGFVGINAAIHKHNKAVEQARLILAAECGIKHATGTHDLCPKCCAAAKTPPQQRTENG